MLHIYVLHLILYLFFISILMIVGRMCTNVTSSYNEEVLLFQFLFQHILVHSFSCMCGTSSFDEEVLEFLKCHVLLCRGGPVFSILVSTNSNYFHFLHMWYLLIKQGGTRVVQILCTRLTRMFSRFASCLHRFTYCQFLYSLCVLRRSCFFIFSFNKFKLFSFLAYVVPPRQTRRYQSCPNFMYSIDKDVL